MTPVMTTGKVLFNYMNAINIDCVAAESPEGDSASIIINLELNQYPSTPEYE